MLILCLTILISIYWLGVLAMLYGAFIFWNAYFMLYSYGMYLCHLVNLSYLWGLLCLVMLILCLTIFIIAALILLATLGVLAILMGAFISFNAYLMPYYTYIHLLA